MQEYVLGFAFDDLDRVALIHKLRPEWQAGLCNGIGGKIEVGESSHSAMMREFNEEAGLLIPSWDYVGEMVKPHEWIVRLFTVTNKVVRDVESKTDELVYLYPSWKLPAKCIANVPMLIAHCRIPYNVRPIMRLTYTK